ncbi:MAG: hypothetical protein QOI59_1748 [Gammaproteobacteria bacterium]|nr:hypothetical protein [Gammaproteobacteria bacterium]
MNVSGRATQIGALICQVCEESARPRGWADGNIDVDLNVRDLHMAACPRLTKPATMQ